jgi:SAM-dependent methyltransferase
MPALSADFCAKEIAALVKATLPHEPIEALVLSGEYEAPLKAVYQLTQEHGASNLVAATTVFSTQGNRAMTASLLGEPDAEAQIQRFAKSFGFNASEVSDLFQRAAKDSVLLTFVAKQEKWYANWFPDPKLRSLVSRNPYFLPAMFHAFRGDIKGTDCCFVGMTKDWAPDAQKTVGLQVGQLMASPGAAESLRDYLLGEKQPQFRSQNSSHSTSALSLEDIETAFKRSFTYKDVADFEGKLVSTLKRHFSSIGVSFKGQQVPLLPKILSRNGASFQLGLHLLVKGMDENGVAAIRDGFETLSSFGGSLDSKAQDAIIATFRQAAADPSLAIHSFGQFAKRGLPSPEALFIQLMRPDLPREQKNGFLVPALMGRPQQLQLVKDVVQFSTTQPGKSKLLEIGYGNPAVLTVLRQYLPGVELIGVDTVAPAARTAQFVRDKMGIDLLQGNISKDTDFSTQLSKKGPFAAIFGVDVFRKTYGGNVPDFQPGPHDQYLKWVADALEPGGVFIILNDNRTLPSFSEAEFANAGLVTVRWNVERVLPEEQRNLFAHVGVADAGHMSLFVLRKGQAAQKLPSND